MTDKEKSNSKLVIPSKKIQIITDNEEYVRDKEHKIYVFVMKFQLKLNFKCLNMKTVSNKSKKKINLHLLNYQKCIFLLYS